MTNIDEIIDRLSAVIVARDPLAHLNPIETHAILTEFKQAVIAEAMASKQGHKDCNPSCTECDWTFDCFSGAGRCRKDRMIIK